MPEITSSGFCLAQFNESYISWVDLKGYVTINLRNTDGTFNVEWFNPLTMETKKSNSILGGNFVVLKSPYNTESVLFLKKE
jgi:hypothetical protein